MTRHFLEAAVHRDISREEEDDGKERRGRGREECGEWREERDVKTDKDGEAGRDEETKEIRAKGRRMRRT